MNSVNYLVQVARVELIALGSVTAVRPEPPQLLEYPVETLIGADTVIDQFVDRPRDRIVHVAAQRIRGEARLVAGLFFDDARRNADRGGSRRHVFHHHRIGADPRTVPDRDRTEDFCAGTDHHAVTESRVALALVPRRAAEGYAVIQRAVVADLRSFADHDTHAVIDEKALSDLRAGMNFHAGQPAPDMRNEARQPAQSRTPQPVRKV